MIKFHFAQRKKIVYGIIVVVVLAFFFELTPKSWSAPLKTFEIQNGEGFREIVDRLHKDGFIRSPFALTAYGFVFGSASVLKPGIYELSSSMSGPRILESLMSGDLEEVEIVIPEGSSVFEIDKVLSSSGVIKDGDLLEYAKSRRIEGYLFPDTYKFFARTEVEDVVKKFVENFDLKARPLLSRDQPHFDENLILASLLEREVQAYEESRIVAGILKKRLKSRMPLQVDATICHIKKQLAGKPFPCYPLSTLDFQVESPYNTYLHLGFPPEPIGSPGLRMIMASLVPQASLYWYYLSDPETGKTIFSKTLDEHGENRVKYLKTKR